MKPLAAIDNSRTERRLLNLAFFLLFPGFFFYHTLLGTGTTGAFFGGYFAPISVLLLFPLGLLYLSRIRRNRQRLTQVHIHFWLYLSYFFAIVVVNAATGANQTIVTSHVLGILFLINIFILFNFVDFAHPEFRKIGLFSLFAMSAIAFIFSVDGVFYLGALGMAKDADSLATYQGFSRSYLVTFLAVIGFTRAMSLRLFLYGLGAATLFLNSARTEFVALLFVMPIIEFYHSKQKLYFILAVVLIVVVLNLNLDHLVAALPNNRILELLDLSQSTSANKRQHLTVYAIQTISTYPIFGSYASYEPGWYSHNILSAWVDLGIFGFVYLVAILVLPLLPMFIREYFAGRRSANFVFGFSVGCVTILLLITSHYFNDMLIGATLGAYSKYRYERKYAKDRALNVRPPAPRYPHLLETMPQLGRPRS